MVIPIRNNHVIWMDLLLQCNMRIDDWFLLLCLFQWIFTLKSVLPRFKVVVSVATRLYIQNAYITFCSKSKLEIWCNTTISFIFAKYCNFYRLIFESEFSFDLAFGGVNRRIQTSLIIIDMSFIKCYNISNDPITLHTKISQNIAQNDYNT